MKKRYDCIILLVSILLPGLLGTAGWGATLSQNIDSILSQKELSKVRFGIHIVDAATGGVLYDRRGGQLFIPASNMKTVVSAAALHYLGADYTFNTRVGLLNDTLVVIGGGDPLLGDKIIDERYGRTPDWVPAAISDALRKAGVAKVRGIIVDSTFFDDQLVHPNWPGDQLNRWYACEVSGLNYNQNCIEVTCRTEGPVCRVSYTPYTRYVSIVDKTQAKNTGDTQVGSYRNGQANHITVFGKCRAPATFEVAIERPAAFFGFVLAEKLRRESIEVWGELVEKYVPERDEISIIKEFHTPISDVLARCNEDSMGLAADAMVKTISAEQQPGRVNGSWEHGLLLTGQYLGRLGVPEDEYILDDGRGLSRENRLSARALTAVLLDMYQSPNWRLYKESLAAGGEEGTVHRYFREPRYQGRVFGKTGYINGVRSFSGACDTKKGTVLFSILSEGGSSIVRKNINDIVERIIDEYEE